MELSILAEVAKLLAGRPVDVDAGDVVRREFGRRIRSTRLQTDAEDAQLAQLNVLAVEQDLAQTIDSLRYDGLNVRAFLHTTV